MIQLFLQGWTLGLTAAFSPGPLQAYLLARTLKLGWRRALPSVLAPLVSDGPIVLLMLVILTRTPDWFLTLVRLVGGLFLIYLAWRAYLAARDTEAAFETSPRAAQQSLLEAAMVNALGPGPYIFWGLIAGPILVGAWRTNPAQGISFLAGFYSSLIAGFTLFVAVYAGARTLGPRVARVLSALSAIALFLFGAYQLWTGLRPVLTGGTG